MDYSDQTFDEARKLCEAQHNANFTRVFTTLKNAGLIRNDDEVEAFDLWEQIDSRE